MQDKKAKWKLLPTFKTDVRSLHVSLAAGFDMSVRRGATPKSKQDAVSEKERLWGDEIETLKKKTHGSAVFASTKSCYV